MKKHNARIRTGERNGGGRESKRKEKNRTEVDKTEK